MKFGVSALLCLYSIVISITLRKNKANGDIIKSISTSCVSRGFFLLFCKPRSLPEFCFHALLTDVCWRGEGERMGFQLSTHAQGSGWNKGKKSKLLGKLRLQFE